MGYRSDVAIVATVLKSQGWDNKKQQPIYLAESYRQEKFKWFLGMLKLKDYEFLRQGEDSWCSHGWGEGMFFLQLNHVKYYESYPEIKEIEGLWQWLGGLDFPFAAKFIRVGEDYDDIEVRTNDHGDQIDMWPEVRINDAGYEDILNLRSSSIKGEELCL